MSPTTWLEVISIIAVIGSPLIALGLQRYAENRREKRLGRLWVFRILMARRATPLHHEYVEALNLIDVVFNSESAKETKVRTDWKILLDHLVENKSKTDFNDVRIELTAQLLADMGNCLGFSFDPVYLKRAAYSPQGHGDVETEQTALRKQALAVLGGTSPISVAIVSDNSQSPNTPSDNR